MKLCEISKPLYSWHFIFRMEAINIHLFVRYSYERLSTNEGVEALAAAEIK